MNQEESQYVTYVNRQKYEQSLLLILNSFPTHSVTRFSDIFRKDFDVLCF